MRPVVSALLLCLFASTYMQAQYNKRVDYTHTIQYEYSLQPDSTDPSFRISETMLLMIGKDYSQFLAENLFKGDSMMVQLKKKMEMFPNGGMPPMRAADRPPAAKIKYRVFKEFAGRQYHFSAAFGMHFAQYTDSFPTFNWQLQDGEQTVAGYACKKATASFAGRSYIAWYAPAIAISDGPYKFYGLPGLILSIYDTARHHVFTAASVQEQQRFATLHKWEGELIHSFPNQSAFAVFAKQMTSDPAKMLEQEYMKLPEDMAAQLIEKMKMGIAKNNNPIELAR